jgi:hypothetical protein
MIRSTHKSRGLAAYRWRHLVAKLGADHPAARAALGRLRFYQGYVPQLGDISPEAIAWHRESGAIVGWWNRAERAAVQKRRSESDCVPQARAA